MKLLLNELLNIKKFTAIILSLVLVMLTLSGCGGATVNYADKINIVCTTFPQYDWVRQILGDKIDDIELTLLLDSGVDLHSYQPTVSDVVRISTCDLFIYVGGESDKWVDDALAGAVNQDMIVINMIDVLGDSVKMTEVIEGMEDDHSHDHDHQDDHEDDHDHDHDHEDDHDHDHEDDHDHDHDHEDDYDNSPSHDHEDEHVWLSLRNAELICIAITDALSLLNTGNEKYYKSNLESYISELSALDEEYKTTVINSTFNTLLFGDRFPFRYLVDDYNLDYYAAFTGCSAETEASFETIVFLAGKLDELGLNSVMVTESSDKSIARTIINNTNNKNQQILVLDSMQSVSSSDISEITYLSVMEDNLEILTQALQ